jgi:hypothetical protein
LEGEVKKGNNCVIDLTKDVLPIERKQDVKVKVKKEEGDKKVKTEKGGEKKSWVTRRVMPAYHVHRHQRGRARRVRSE